MKKAIALLAVVCGLLLSMTSPLWAEVTKLRVACVVSPKSVYNAGMLKPWGEMIEKRTKAIGKPIQVTIFPGESIVKATEHYKALTNGTIDVDSMIGVHLVDDGDIAASVMNLPLLFKDTKSMALTALDLAAKYPDFMKPYTAKSKVLWFQPTGPSNVLASVKKPIKTLEDLKGLKTRSAGLGISSDVVKALGSIPIDIQMPDIYEGLNNGLLDYMSKNWEAYMAFKWYEPTRYRTVLPRGLWSDFLVTAMNWDTWNKLSPDVQKIIDELSDRRQMTVEVAGKMDQLDQQLRGAILGIDKKSGKAEPYVMPEEEFNRWRKAVEPVYRKWTDMMEAKGLPGKKLLQDAMQLSDKYGK